MKDQKMDDRLAYFRLKPYMLSVVWKVSYLVVGDTHLLDSISTMCGGMLWARRESALCELKTVMWDKP